MGGRPQRQFGLRVVVEQRAAGIPNAGTCLPEHLEQVPTSSQDAKRQRLGSRLWTGDTRGSCLQPAGLECVRRLGWVRVFRPRGPCGSSDRGGTVPAKFGKRRNLQLGLMRNS